MKMRTIFSRVWGFITTSERLVLCSRFMKVCGGGAFTMADDTICMEIHITCVNFTKVFGGNGVFT